MGVKVRVGEGLNGAGQESHLVHLNLLRKEG